MSRLLHELNNTPNPLSSPVAWRQSRDLPYLDACIKEAGRLHPPFGLPLERVVPPEGAVICGEFLKGGTVVGISAWVIHRDRETFGEDCDEWKPERWLCEEGRRRKMENALLTVLSTPTLLVFIATYLIYKPVRRRQSDVPWQEYLLFGSIQASPFYAEEIRCKQCAQEYVFLPEIQVV